MCCGYEKRYVLGEKGKLGDIYGFRSTIIRFVIGMALSGMFNTTLCVTAIIIIGIYVFNTTFSTAGILIALLIFILVLAALYNLSPLFTSIYLMYSRSGQRVSELLSEPMMFLSEMYYLLSVISTNITDSNFVFPLAVGIDDVRKTLIYSVSVNSIICHAILLIILVIILFLAGIKILGYIENKLKETRGQF